MPNEDRWLVKVVYWTATRAKKKFDYQYKFSFSEFRIIDSKTGEIV